MRTSAETLEYFNRALASMPLDRQPASLYEPIKYVLSLGGKRIRPVLLLMAYELYHDDTDSALSTALGLETYHNYTLLHDDVMDRADVRRGKPTVHKVWNENAAILSGDAMLVLAYRLMAETAPRHLKAVMDLFTETALEIGEGQQMDLEFETRDDVREEEYIEMIRLKTSVLLACALKLGALQADAPAADANRLYHFGEQLGLAFQLQDDLLDVYGDFKTFGKKIGGATATEPEKKIAAVTELYNQIGVRQLAEAKIHYYFEAALACLDEVALPSERKENLRSLALSLLGRKN